jgi:hypothetical protein
LLFPSLAVGGQADAQGLFPGLVFRGQVDSTGYAPADPTLPVPLGSTHLDQGGLYTWVDYVMYRQTNPLKEQQIAYYGFLTADDSVPGVPAGSSGLWIGSRALAFDVQQVTGPNSYQPGFEVGIGWRFGDGSTLSLGWTYLSETRTTAVVTSAIPGYNFGATNANSFITAVVYNFPSDFSGPPNRINGADATAAYGIWDAADVMTEAFIQRYQQWELTYRIPVFETENYRLSGLTGPRFVWIWERYQWTTHADSQNGSDSNPTEADTGIYTNIDSNRMYGVKIGCSNEYYFGHGFAGQLDLQAAAFLDSVKEREKYELALKFIGPENKRALRQFTFVPELQATASLQWFPTEFVQVRVGYDIFAFWNTLSSPRPIDFNYSSLTAPYESTFRLFDGFRAGVAIIF